MGAETTPGGASPALPGVLFDKASIVRFVPMEAWATYRLETFTGELVYAGATGRPAARLLEHLRSGKPADLVRIQFHRNSTAMARAERLLLAAEESTLPSGHPRRHHAWKAQNR